MGFIEQLWFQEKGQGMVEYGLLMGIFVLLLFASVIYYGNFLIDMYTRIADKVVSN